MPFHADTAYEYERRLAVTSFHADTAYEYRWRLAVTWFALEVGRGRLSHAPMTVTVSRTGTGSEDSIILIASLWYLL
jgi:hypothetical protein